MKFNFSKSFMLALLGCMLTTALVAQPARKLVEVLIALLAGCKSEDPNFTIDVTEHFDREFALLLEERRYIPDATKITLADVKDLKKIDVSGLCLPDPGVPGFFRYYGKLTSLAGIEYFSALDSLNCDGNQLTVLSLNKNMLLTGLSCANNQLTTLDISKNTALKELYCYNNQLTTLDISENRTLTGLSCSGNKLMTLDTNKNTVLKWLFCVNNQLTTLDISKNVILRELRCHNNPSTGGVFPVVAWFDNNSIPADFTAWNWGDLNGNVINIEYIKK